MKSWNKLVLSALLLLCLAPAALANGGGGWGGRGGWGGGGGWGSGGGKGSGGPVGPGCGGGGSSPVPEGGSSAIYLAGAGLVGLGAIVLRARAGKPRFNA